jgi:succinate dehydrogenase / fumarate reductase cytochrome b subunit
MGRSDHGETYDALRQKTRSSIGVANYWHRYGRCRIRSGRLAPQTPILFLCPDSNLTGQTADYPVEIQCLKKLLPFPRLETLLWPLFHASFKDQGIMSPSEAKSARPPGRPLSPHLQVYRPQLTSILSILHRITGCGLSFGFIVFVAWLAALARGPEAYASFTSCADSVVGQIILFGLTVAFFYHFCNGIRHLLWDAGWGLELPEVYKTGYIVLGATAVLTAIVWLKVIL